MASNLPAPQSLTMTGVSRPSVDKDGFPVQTRLFVNLPDLAENPVVGPYASVSEYLDIHYDLLSEDFLFYLRKRLKDTKCRGQPIRGVKFETISNGFCRGKHWYVNCSLSIEDKGKTPEPAFGSLLVFSEGDFDKSLFLGKVISDKDSAGKSLTELELKLPLDQDTGELSSRSFAMIEAEAFYYMFYHVLKVLDSLSEQTFPMKKYIVYGKEGTEIGHPSYLTMMTLYKMFDRWAPVLGPSRWPWSYECSDMDESQFCALEAAVTQELAVIYGAPGTGKTYFGVRLVKVFLDNVNVWNRERNTPLLVVCQSNQALDHFMVNLLPYTDEIVRIGDQCQSRILMPHSLREKVCRHLIKTSRKFENMDLIRLHLARIDKIRQEIEDYNKGLRIASRTGYKEKLEMLEYLENELNNSIWDKVPNKFGNQLHVLKSSLVIGLTSTAAAARRNYLDPLKPPIVIIEEAGEMLEAHVVVSMTEHCQHLILLGDTKQLKPMINTYHLGRDYNLNTSLFERLLTNRIAKGCSLTTQHRMQPEIANLLRPHIYEVLHDSTGIQRRTVRGLSKNVFFLDHRQQEQKSDHDHWNVHEVSTLIHLAHYLVVYRKYPPTDIAIITTYAEQRNRLLEARDKLPGLAAVEVATVDGYQGRENEIILLSLVRSNPAGKIGFLGEESRICVALSRARTGLFMMGNMACLQKSLVWNKVRLCLEKQQQIAPYFTLHCEEHQQTSHEICELGERDLRFCRSCYEATVMPGAAGSASRIADKNDSSVYVNVPHLTYDLFRCDLKPDFRSDYDRSHWHERTRKGRDCLSNDCGARICGLLLAAFTLGTFGALFWALFGPKK